MKKKAAAVEQVKDVGQEHWDSVAKEIGKMGGTVSFRRTCTKKDELRMFLTVRFPEDDTCTEEEDLKLVNVIHEILEKMRRAIDRLGWQPLIMKFPKQEPKTTHFFAGACPGPSAGQVHWG